MDKNRGIFYIRMYFMTKEVVITKKS